MSKLTASRFGQLPVSAPKPKNLKSWWAEPDLQVSREAFQRQLVNTEISRMNGNQRFGGSKRLIDKFPTEPKK